ncbi:uncharacterized protein LOC142564237 isoform X3 [Dermacentor variabilis]|uniref:uncharacterized protein LOC142564237 isoform X3 n=1 Tax=Dermacentor variabilis TaxID=34621 RepID=UPI003F5CB130
MRAKLGETSVRNCLFQLQNKGPSLQSPVTPVVCELTTSSLPHLSLTLKLYSTSPFILPRPQLGQCPSLWQQRRSASHAARRILVLSTVAGKYGKTAFQLRDST